jgi:hypothetical protein
VTAPPRISLSRPVLIGLGLLMLVQAAGVVTQLFIVADQRRINREQRELIETQVDAVLPLLKEARPLSDDVRAAIPPAKRTLHHVDALARGLTPRIEDLRAAGTLAAVLLEADPARAVRTTTDVLGLLREIVPRQYEIQRETLRAQLEGLAIQRQALATVQETLAVAREAEAHAESLDRKTGGETTPAPGVVSPP